jgi:hypothetical protein
VLEPPGFKPDKDNFKLVLGFYRPVLSASFSAIKSEISFIRKISNIGLKKSVNTGVPFRLLSIILSLHIIGC